MFLHQSLSSPVLSAIAKAEGIWIEDTTGRRYMDFHGNSVHHIGYGHPRLKAAIKAQLDELSFAPRRFTCEPAVELAERLTARAPGDLGKVLTDVIPALEELLGADVLPFGVIRRPFVQLRHQVDVPHQKSVRDPQEVADVRVEHVIMPDVVGR